MDKTEALNLLKRSEEQLDKDSGRTRKPRRTGITMSLVFDVANQGPKFIEPFQDLVDRIKLLDTMWHGNPAIVFDAVAAYRAMNMDVAMGGTQFEIAKAQNGLKAYIKLLKSIGINEVEVENHASGATLREMQDEVKMLKDEGFIVVGEVGKKWWWKDPTRISRDLISVERTTEQALGLIEAGADYLYWEGMIVRALIGPQLENTEGQKQLREVARAIDPAKLILELWDDRGQSNHPLLAWLVKEFGPNVNLANIFPQDVKWVEWIRHGIIFEMDHPYFRWAQDRSQAPHWWQMEGPDYDVDMQRGYALKPAR
ncbi:MAG: phosphosulfolactate synthase [Betaproteobacteria bacterium]|nr:phosphosulfolactate synthase [Betaproteobacteria bacterium]